MKKQQFILWCLASLVGLVPLAIACEAVMCPLSTEQMKAHMPGNQCNTIETIVTYDSLGQCTGVVQYRYNDEMIINKKPISRSMADDAHTFENGFAQPAPAEHEALPTTTTELIESLDPAMVQAVPAPVASAVPHINTLFVATPPPSSTASVVVAAVPSNLPFGQAASSAQTVPVSAWEIQDDQVDEVLYADDANECLCTQNCSCRYLYFCVGVGLLAAILYATSNS